GGYLPIAATAATEEVYDAFLGAYEEFKTFFHGHTYTGNALACAAGLASLEVFDEEGTLDALSGKIERFTQGLAAVAELPHVAGIRQAGVMIGIELVADTATGEGYAPRRRIGHQVCMKARERDVIIRPLSDVIILNPPLSITPSQIDHLLETVHWSIEQITQGRDQDQGDDAP
ncbi:aminotransferase class III-fold pyridoxal phosphate-dependent enzyme, partial [bacterium]|nr:aminotransferase class III-fold pyridoxal phosphate-dependent enzyme [bacterium]